MTITPPGETRSANTEDEGARSGKRAGRWIELKALDRRFYEPLWELVGSEQVPWTWRGRSMSYEAFLETLMSEVLVQFPIVVRATGKCIGLIRAEKANVFHQHAYVALYLDPAYQKKGWPMEAMPLFIDYLFERYNLHKLYGESAEYALDMGTLGGFANIEGVLKDHYFINGTWTDMRIISITRADWYENARPTVAKFLWHEDVGELDP